MPHSNALRDTLRVLRVSLPSSFQQPVDVLGEHVGFQVEFLADLGGVQVGLVPSVRDNAEGGVILTQAGDRQ